MSKKFESKFNLDEKKLPRRWKPSDDISKIFMEARQEAESYIEKFSILRLKPELDEVKYLDAESTTTIDPAIVILTHEEASMIKDKFYKETDSSYLQAVRDQENVSSTAHIPMYVIILLIVLGFDEFMSVITNPLLLILIVLLGAGGYVIYMLNLGGPAKRILETLLYTSASGLQRYLSDQVMKPHTTAPPPTSSTSSSNPSNKKED